MRSHIAGSRKQIAHARWITDRVTLAYLADVFVLPQYAGQGLGKWFVEEVLMKILPQRTSDKVEEKLGTDEPSSVVLDYRDMQFLLRAAADAKGFYERYGGFEVVGEENNMMTVLKGGAI